MDKAGWSVGAERRGKGGRGQVLKRSAASAGRFGGLPETREGRLRHLRCDDAERLRSGLLPRSAWWAWRIGGVSQSGLAPLRGFAFRGALMRPLEGSASKRRPVTVAQPP